MHTEVTVDGIERFADPWEHLRLLSDSPRNEALLALLERRAPGARVLEVGCGTGLWSCVAAKLGAREVWAVEPTEICEVARELIETNQLSDRVHLLEDVVEDLDPRPVDLAFSELLNADPFYEGVVEACDAAAAWVVEGGLLAPRRLRVYAQLVGSSESAREYHQALAAVAQVGQRYDLDVRTLLEGLRQPGPYCFVSAQERPISDAVLLWDVALGTGVEPAEEVRAALRVPEAATVGGVVVWFEAELDDGIVMHNRLGARSHWGQFASGWPEQIDVAPNDEVRIVARLDDDQLSVDAVG